MNAPQTYLNDRAYCRGLTGDAARRSFLAPDAEHFTTPTADDATANLT